MVADQGAENYNFFGQQKLMKGNTPFEVCKETPTAIRLQTASDPTPQAR